MPDQDAPEQYEPHPDTRNLTNDDYNPYPEKSKTITSASHGEVMTKICNLYSGQASEDNMRVYAEKAIYDDPFSYCDTRYKIAGQWYGIPKLFSTSRTIATEIVADSPTEMSWKNRQEYTLVGLHTTKTVNSLVTLTFDDEGKVKYHKDQWNEKDYSHEGLGFLFKKMNGDYLTGITQPPKDL